MDLPQYTLLNNTLPRMPGACSILVDRCKSHELLHFPVETLLIMFMIQHLYAGAALSSPSSAFRVGGK